MYAPILHSHILPKPLLLHLPSHSTPPFSRATVCSATSNNSSTASDDGSSTPIRPPNPPPTQSSTPSETVEVRFRRGSRRRRQQQRQQETGQQQLPGREKASTPKKWEEMTIAEKALELYLGEKGALFWLNKFAYASIFIIIGAWILFRFVGPALNLYQLDSPPLSPESIFKG